MRGIMFNGDGPTMSGTWYNVKTGDSFTVRDTFFEDNRMIIQTMDGRMLDFERIQDYVQSNQPIEMPNKQEVLPAEVESLLGDNTSGGFEMTNEELIELQALTNPTSNQPKLGNIYNGNSGLDEGLGTTISVPVLTNNSIIDKALSKRDLPNIQIGIDWDKFPSREINMLMELMDVDGLEIIEWYISKLDIASVRTMIADSLTQFIGSKLFDEEGTTEGIPETPAAPPVNKEKEKKMGGPKARAAGRPKKNSKK